MPAFYKSFGRYVLRETYEAAITTIRSRISHKQIIVGHDCQAFIPLPQNKNTDITNNRLLLSKASAFETKYAADSLAAAFLQQR
ncbi:MAG: hypothetical protein J7497_01325 [Chitinophagaceae bacterium]|nr:hypothetical protein [Chitinophagaceae bacterium]